MNVKSSFILGLLAGFVLSAAVIRHRYIHILPAGSLFASRQDLVCKVTHCQGKTRPELMAQEMLAFAKRDAVNDKTHPEYRDPAFWKRFESEKKADLESIAKELGSMEDDLYKDVPRDLLLVEILGGEIDQEIKQREWAGPGLHPWAHAHDRFVALLRDYSPKGSSPGAH